MSAVGLEPIAEGAFLVRLHAPGRVDGAFVEALHGCLDRLEATRGDACFVLAGEGGGFCAGFDPGVLHTPAGPRLVAGAGPLLARLLAFPVPSAAAVGGPAGGVGALLALCCDFQCMATDATWWLPPRDLGVPLSAASALLRQKLAPRVAADVLLSGRRLGGREAAALGVVDEVAEADVLTACCLARVAPLAGKHRETYEAQKRGLHRAALAGLEGTPDG